jgi:L-methionine (R)-S-oxide reductase
MILDSTADEILNSLGASGLRGEAFRIESLRLIDGLENYNWTGIYYLEGENLVLGPFFGADTDHRIIPTGQGVCGTAVAEDQNQVIEDVRELSNYLACSVGTRAEIVVLIKKNDKILGQIDIDSDKVGAFDKSDERFLERVASLIADRWN